MRNIEQVKDLEEILENDSLDSEMVMKFRERIQEGRLSIDEDPVSHISTYFPAVDFSVKKVFIGHHKKADRWLFNGGHIDRGETVAQTLKREVNEEWGLNIDDLDITSPEFLTITEIAKNSVRPCKAHYDLWCFVSVDKDNFNPLEEKLFEEFYEIKWKSVGEARGLVDDGNTLKAIDFIEEKYFK